MKKHLSLTVTGKVQGVFFRASAKEKADELGVSGLVRNQSDGSVYLEAEGEGDILEQLVAWCRQGPPRSIVSNVRVEEGTLKEFTHFEIQR